MKQEVWNGSTRVKSLVVKRELGTVYGPRPFVPAGRRHLVMCLVESKKAHRSGSPVAPATRSRVSVIASVSPAALIAPPSYVLNLRRTSVVQAALMLESAKPSSSRLD